MSFNGISALIALFVFLAIPIGIITAIFAIVTHFGHRKKRLFHQTVIAEYESPEGLSPAELGYLFDSRLNKIELVATLQDLEQRGMITITHKSTDGLNISPTHSGMTTGLKNHEEYVLERLHQQTNLAVFSLANMHGFGRQVKRSLAEQGYIKDGKETVRYIVRGTFIAYPICFLPVAIWICTGASASEIPAIVFILFILSIGFFPSLIAVAILASVIYNKFVGQPGLWTPKLKKLWPEIEGYREFIKKVELDEIQFESDDLKMATKNKALPYATALNLNTEWQKRF